MDALDFAQEELAPRGEESPEFLAELEKTMALLAFESSPSAPPAIAELLSPAQRLKTAGEVNAAILESLSQGKDAKLVGLLKLLCWGESMLDEHAEFPKVRLAWLLLLSLYSEGNSGNIAGFKRGDICGVSCTGQAQLVMVNTCIMCAC